MNNLLTYIKDDTSLLFVKCDNFLKLAVGVLINGNSNFLENFVDKKKIDRKEIEDFLTNNKITEYIYYYSCEREEKSYYNSYCNCIYNVINKVKCICKDNKKELYVFLYVDGLWWGQIQPFNIACFLAKKYENDDITGFYIFDKTLKSKDDNKYDISLFLEGQLRTMTCFPNVMLTTTQRDKFVSLCIEEFGDICADIILETLLLQKNSIKYNSIYNNIINIKNIEHCCNNNKIEKELEEYLKK